MKTVKKGQSALEFVLLVSFMLLVFFVFFIVIQGKLSDIISTRDYQYLEEANNAIFTEFEIAWGVHADYFRTFTIPTISDKLYLIEMGDPYELTTKYGTKEYVNFLSEPVKGSLHQGENDLYKLDGNILLSDGTLYENLSYAGLFLNVNPEACYLADANSSCDTLSYKSDCQSLFGLC
ncbi:hypothetical protein K9M74_01620 [Candidatus Woesearchaeota archaeon]|nr:hypothetical protein [Candidatus Woesearchaeota archaeon]